MLAPDLVGEAGGEEEAESRHVEEPTTHVLATIGILIATVLATIAATLAAFAGYHANVADTKRLDWSTYSEQVRLSERLSLDASTGAGDVNTQNYWQSALSTSLSKVSSSAPALAFTGPSFSALGSLAAPQSISGTPVIALPAGVSYCAGLASKDDCAAEVADAWGRASLNYSANERAYLAIVSILAIALFLLALSKSLDRPAMQWLFLALGALFTLVSLGWLLAEPSLTKAAPPVKAAIVDYERSQLSSVGSSQTFHLLEQSTKLDPAFADAWSALGQASSCRTAVAALQNAVALRHSSLDYDSLAYDELSCGHPRTALADLAIPLQDPSDAFARQVLAGVRLGLGETKASLAALRGAISAVGGPTVTSGRGEVFRLGWFELALQDHRNFLGLGATAAQLRPYDDLLRSREALLEIRDAHLAVPPRDGGSVSNVTLSPDPLLASDATSTLVPERATFTYRGLTAGDVISMIWHRSDLSSTTATVPPTTLLVVGQPGGPAPGDGVFATTDPSFFQPGRYLVDLGVDGRPAGTWLTPFSVRAGTAGR